VAVAAAVPYPPSLKRRGPGLLLDGPHFSVALVEAVEADPFAGRPRFLLPLGAGPQCLFIEAGDPLPNCAGTALLAAAP
jgi:hypothetical protein